MDRFIELFRRFLPHALTILAFGFYAVVFVAYHDRFGTGLASLATIPVIVASWYFGTKGGVSFAGLATVASGYFLASAGESLIDVFTQPGNILRVISLFFIALIVGGMANLLRERNAALSQLEEIEQERRAYASFLEFLNHITGMALEAHELGSTLKILVEQIAVLFEADDCYFARWDDTTETTFPITAYGTQRDIYPQIRFEPGERTLTAFILNAARPIPIPDTKNSPYISPKITSLFPNKSLLGLPLVVQGSRLGAMILGYKENHSFSPGEITRAEIAAEQIALVLLKSQLLEEERKQVRRLTALHDVALTSIEADNEDQLIERVTGIIGQNLFPDNFGIMLLDESGEVLRPHSSYRFLATDRTVERNVPVGQGITGEVVMTGKSQRLGNVRLNPQYMMVEDRIDSELCVPIKFKEQILGVINAESVERDAFTIDDERLLVTLAGQLATAIEQLRKAKAERNWLDQLAHSNDLIYAIAQITTRLETTLTMQEIIQQLGAELQKIDMTCIMAIHDPEHDTFTIKYTSLTPEHLGIVDRGLGYPMLHYTFPRGSLMKDTLKSAAVGRPEDEIESLFRDTERPGVLRILREIGITPGIEPLRLPLIVEDALLGILWIWGRDIRKSDLPILSIFARQVGVSLERARLFQEVQNLAVTDPLTGLHNRRNLFGLGRIEFSRGLRLNRPFCSMMLDIDHFKQINDRFGHAAGDLVLQEFAKLCQRSVREIDLIGRYGGEEIIIFLPETELDIALHVAERLRASVADSALDIDGREINITVSIGVAAKDGNTPDLETLIARADQAMYIAKHMGRDRVSVSR